jgi:hypothetical protein
MERVLVAVLGGDIVLVESRLLKLSMPSDAAALARTGAAGGLINGVTL